jgi:Phage integrase family
VRTVAIPVWVKNAINAWQTASKIEDGRLLRPLSKSGRILGEELGDWAIWSVVEASAKDIGIEHFGAHDLGRTCAKLCRKNGGDLEQIKFLLGHSSIQTTERYLGSEQDIVIAITTSNDAARTQTPDLFLRYGGGASRGICTGRRAGRDVLLQCTLPLSMGSAFCDESPALRRTEKDCLRIGHALR